MNYNRSLLSPESDCLGIALLEVAAQLELNLRFEDAKAAETPVDAIKILAPFAELALVSRFNANVIDRLVVECNACRFGIPFKRYEDLGESFLILCQRSLRQLYGMKRAELHWILVYKTATSEGWLDPLEDLLDEMAVSWRKRNSVSEIMGDIGSNIAISP